MIEENISETSITSRLNTDFVGQRVVYYPETTSTMDIARQEAKRGAAEGTVVIADRQTAGRGRLQRTWFAPSGNIALSIILYPELTYLPNLIMLASLSVVHTIREVCGIEAKIKWPNDILINGKKVCGILIENDLKAGIVGYSNIGIGLNVNINLSDFPEIKEIATSLSGELGREVSRLRLIRSLLVEFEKLYLTSTAGGSIFEEWRDNLITIGRKVRATAGDTVYEGIAESVDSDGSLLIRSSDGKLTKVIVGDVTLRE